MEKLMVNLGDRSYPIHFGAGMTGEFAAACRSLFPTNSFALVTNSTLAALYKTTLSQWEAQLGIKTITIPDGEKHKTISTWEAVLSAMLEAKLDRGAVVIAFGGGVVGDITGFAAACYLRGVRYMQVPTTLLAMVDSSVGGKTGVNHPVGKNLIGAFHQPSLVWVDTDFLDTLPQREFIAGYAELFKYAFIGGRDMFQFVNTMHDRILGRDKGPLIEGIQRSIAIKARVVEQDEKEESGARAMLNFGHTFAHTIERFYNFDGIIHGEAVLLGILCACDLGVRIGSIPLEARAEYDEIVRKVPRVELPSPPDITALYEGMFSDKKTKRGKINFIVPSTPGNAILKNDIAREAVLETLHAVFDRYL
jgi:3-dehydroquinate synthase